MFWLINKIFFYTLLPVSRFLARVSNLDKDNHCILNQSKKYPSYIRRMAVYICDICMANAFVVSSKRLFLERSPKSRLKIRLPSVSNKIMH